MNSTLDQEVSPVPKSVQQQVFLDKFQELLTKTSSSSITLTNVYKEMPITHPAFLREVKDRHVEFQTCELQLAAINQCHEAYIRSPLVGSPVLGKLDRVDLAKGMVRLTEFSFKELLVDRRKTVRVRFPKPISILARCGTNKISGVINDISLGGCCMNTFVREEIDAANDIIIELNLMVPSIGQGLNMQIPSRLLRITGDSPPFKCAFSFSHTSESQQLLFIYMNQRQSEILKELRDTFK
jgi:hypothetical protein